MTLKQMKNLKLGDAVYFVGKFDSVLYKLHICPPVFVYYDGKKYLRLAYDGETTIFEIPIYRRHILHLTKEEALAEFVAEKFLH